jgi:hypothetical protein
MGEFVKDRVPFGSRYLLAVDCDYWKRHAKQRQTSHFFQGNFRKLEHQDSESLYRGSPRIPGAPFVSPVKLRQRVDSNGVPHARAHIGGWFAEMSSQVEFRNSLSEFGHQIQRILSSTKHLAKREPQFGRFVSGLNAGKPSVICRQGCKLWRTLKKEYAKRSAQKCCQLLDLPECRLAFTALPSRKPFFLHLEASRHALAIITALLTRPREEDRVDWNGFAARHSVHKLPATALVAKRLQKESRDGVIRLLDGIAAGKTIMPQNAAGVREFLSGLR